MEAATHETLTVRTHDNVGVVFSPAGLGSRFFAQIVDTLVFLPVGLALLFGVQALLESFVPNDSSSDSFIGTQFTALATGLTLLMAYALYFILSEGFSGGRTLGKRVAGVRVVRLDGSAIGMTESLIRNLTRSPLLAVADIIAGPFMLIFHPQSRRLGDLFAGTVVVREAKAAVSLAAALPPPVYLHIHDPGPAIAGIERLGQRELAALRTFLGRIDLHPAQRFRVAADMSAKLLDRLGLPPDAVERREPPELVIERMYLQLNQVQQ